MGAEAPSILQFIASEGSEAVFRARHKGLIKPSDFDSFRAAFNVATKLHLISEYLGSLPPYWIDHDVERLCSTIVDELTHITRFAKGSTRSTFNGPASPEARIASYFKSNKERAQTLSENCDFLCAKLETGEDYSEELPHNALENLKKDHSTQNLGGDSVFNALHSIMECIPTSHENQSAIQTNELPPLHPSRLCLHQETGKTASSPSISILISTMDMSLWQEFSLRLRPERSMDEVQMVLGRGSLCQILEDDVNARLLLSFGDSKSLRLLKNAQVLKRFLNGGIGESLASVLRQYNLTSKDKVILAYAIARSYWQYYDSMLMRTKWTSETIWFMPEKDPRGSQGQLPLCAYIALPYGVSNNTTPEILYEGLLTHKYPRIFDIGVLLLEIGLSKPFQAENRGRIVPLVNRNHKRANDKLTELKNMDWGGFTNKTYYDQAVKFCFDSYNFVHKSEEQGSTMALNCEEAVSARKQIFHKHVVLPLQYLAEGGFKAQLGEITYVNKKAPSSAQRDYFEEQGETETQPLFHSNLVPNMWLTDLKKISADVELKRRDNNVISPVRVAILDTGLNKSFPPFKANGDLIRNLVHEEDFVATGDSVMTDTFGHGTFMARLIMECAPGAEISVARVARNTKELGKSKESIRKAILWAGQIAKADIISMSFGFPSDDKGICEAIETVQKTREGDVIFLASAGNSSTDDESFPARHPAVISVYATNCHGNFLQSNSMSTANGATVLGTYGADIPDFIYDEFRTTYPKVCQPGSSVATAIMAGISAIMLAYAPILSRAAIQVGTTASNCHHVLRHLRTTRGMDAVLRRLAQDNLDHPRCKAVKLAWFWKNKPTDIMRFCPIYDALADINRRYPTP